MNNWKVQQYHNSKNEEEGKEKKLGKRTWLWRAGPKQGQDLGSGQGLFLGPINLEKVLGAVGGGA